MGEFVRIDPRGKSDRQLLIAALKQAEATHGCLETHIGVTERAHRAATEAREQLAKKVDEVAGAVGALDTRQDIVEGSVKALATALGGQMQSGTVKIRTKFGLMDFLKFAGAAGASLGLVVFLVQLIVHIGPAAIGYIMGLSPT